MATVARQLPAAAQLASLHSNNRQASTLVRGSRRQAAPLARAAGPRAAAAFPTTTPIMFADAATMPPPVAADAALPPTPVLPSGTMMAEFLSAYRRMLQHECKDGDHAAEAGENVLERVRIGLMALIGHPQHGAFAGSSWHVSADSLESCLEEIEKDIQLMHKYHTAPPTRTARQLTSLHCMEAERLLRKL